MNYEEKILELQRRIEVLEKAESKRIAKRKRQIVFEVCKVAVILGIVVLFGIYVYSNWVKPYKEKVDFVNDKIESVEGFVNDKLSIIDKYNTFA